MKKQTARCNYIIGIYFAVLTFFISIDGTSNPFAINRIGTDSAVFRYVAQTIIKGGMPYRDTFDHKGPIIYLIDVLGMTIQPEIGIWIVELLTLFSSVALIYIISLKLNRNKTAAIVATTVGMLTIRLYLEGGNFTEEYALPFILLSLLLFIEFFQNGRIDNYKVLLCGASFAIVCMLRINMIALWAVMCPGVIIYQAKSGGINKFVKTSEYFLWFVVGMMFVVGPILIWLRKNGAFQDFVYDYFTFNFKYTDDPAYGTMNGKIRTFFDFSTSIPMVVCYCVFAYYCITEQKLLYWLSFAGIWLSVLFASIAGRYNAHYGLVFVPFIVFAASIVLNDLLISLQNNYDKRKVIGAGVALILGILLSFSGGAASFCSHMLDIVRPY